MDEGSDEDVVTSCTQGRDVGGKREEAEVEGVGPLIRRRQGAGLGEELSSSTGQGSGVRRWKDLQLVPRSLSCPTGGWELVKDFK